MTASTGFDRGKGTVRSTKLARELALMPLRQGPGGWTARAACRGIEDPEVMFPVATQGTAVYQRQLRAAQAVCTECPVRAECLEYALSGEDVGVWGGLDPAERRALAHARRSTSAADDLGEVA